jgi:CRP-like cAMP-binding protein
VFHRGEAAGKFYVVAGGVVEARHEAPDLVARFTRSDLVCGYGAFGQADNEYVAVALTPAVVLSFREEDFFDVMEEHFELTRSVLAGIASDYERLLVERDRRAG